MMQGLCGACLYYLKPNNGSTALGLCRRYPPSRKIEAKTPDGAEKYEQIPVSRTGVCGEFKKDE